MPRILHTSDVHLGEHVHGAAGTQTSFLALRAVVELALHERVDLVLFAGDLFDNNRVPLELSDLVARELGRLPMPSVILPGNHDPFDSDSVYHRMDLPDAVGLITQRGGQTLPFPSIGVEVWGRPHMSYSEDLRPLQDVPPPVGERWRVAIGHGHLVRSDADLMRSYLIRSDEIPATGRDYVALGHWDLHHDLSSDGVAACYSGSPNRKGVSVLVDLERTGTRLRALEFSFGAG